MSTLHNGSCVNSCTPSKTCSDYGRSADPSGDCYAIKYNVSNGCTNSLTCYVNGCEANGYNGYSCYPRSDDFQDLEWCDRDGAMALNHGYCVSCGSSEDTQQALCSGLPTYGEWVNQWFTQTRYNGARTPSSKSPTYSNSSSIECSFICDRDHTWSAGSCVCPDTQLAYNCEHPQGQGEVAGTWGVETCQCACPIGYHVGELGVCAEDISDPSTSYCDCSDHTGAIPGACAGNPGYTICCWGAYGHHTDGTQCDCQREGRVGFQSQCVW